MNKVILIGRLTRDLKLYKTQNKKSFSFFTLAVNNNLSQTNFISCVSWNKIAEKMCEYLVKGSLISLIGRLSVRKIINQEKKEQYITEVIAENVTFLDYRKSENILNNNKEQSLIINENKINLENTFQNSEYNNLKNEIDENINENNNIEFNEEEDVIWNN